jgi:hypothetical protein
LSAFSFDAKGTKEKAWQKENAERAFRALRSATKDAVFGYCDLLKKVDQNFAPDNAWSKTNAVEDQCGRRPMRSKTVAVEDHAKNKRLPLGKRRSFIKTAPAATPQGNRIPPS